MGPVYHFAGDRYGKTFKSKGEYQIARFLERNQIRYQYEHPLAVVDRGQVRIWYPDFLLPEYGITLEYFGVNGKRSYAEQTQHKKEVYQQAGIQGIFLTEDSFWGYWPGRIMRQIEDILQGRVDHFYRRQGQPAG